MLTIYSLNANGLRDKTKLKNILTACDFYKCDILCLQETFWSEDIMSEVKKLWKGHVFYNNYNEQHRKGVAILVKKEISQVKHVAYGDKGRLLKITFEYSDKLINVFSVYAPNDHSKRRIFFRDCKKFINENEINIIGGDFNDYADILLDRSNTMSSNVPNNYGYVSFMQKNNMVDIWRHKNPNKRTFSRRQKVNGILKQSRIDAFLISRNCIPHTINSFYRLSSFSDHSYVCIKLDFNEIERGPGMWIFNNTLLNDDLFCSRIHDVINKELQCPLYQREILVWWDNLKYKLKSFSKYFSKKKHKDKQQEFWNIHNKLYTRIDRGLDVDDNLVLALENELQNYEKYRCEGAILRSKASWAIESDKNTKYFLQLEKYKQNSNCVKELLTSDNETVSDTMKILETEVEFYECLYSEETSNEDDQNTLFNNISRTITNNGEVICEEDICLSHLTKSLKEMNKNKSPGSDGLTVEFYLKFWKTLGPLLEKVVSKIQKSKHMTKTMKKGIISLIYKKKGDKKLLKNWRPITLLNVDYKIISKTLASRLKLVLEDIISTEQTCSVPGRDISDNIASVRDIIEYCYKENTLAYILKLDSEKAFDRVSHEYLFNLLPHFGFGKNFVEWVKILYTDISSAVKCNGHISRFFNVKRSVRQGCSLSAMLYIVAAEPLNLLYKHSTLKGINIKQSPMTSLIYQHADDTTLTLADKESVVQSFKLFDIYGKASGAKVNVEKSEVLIINDSVNSLSHLNLPFDVKSDFLEILGVALGIDKNKCEHINWKKKIEKIDCIMHLWQQRCLSLRGRSIVIQTLLSSRIWYILNVQPLPEWAETHLKKCFTNFLWNGKPPQIKATTLIGKENQGGLNIPDIRLRCLAFRLKWLRKYFDSDVNIMWKHTMNHFLSNYQNMGLTYETFSLIYEKISLNKVPLFYRELLEAWDTINLGERQMPMSLPDIYNQPLFSNPNIIKETKMLYFHVFIKCGITKIMDIVNQHTSGFVGHCKVYDRICTYYPKYDKQKAKELYNYVLYSMPNHWKDRINQTHCVQKTISIPEIIVGNTMIPASSFSSKICYDIFRSRKYQSPTSLPFIQSFGLNSNLNLWKTIFGSYKSPDMINLDYKIAHGIVWTGEKLYRAKKSTTNVCQICSNEIEDLLHIFVECDHLESFHKFLSDIMTYFYRNKGFTIEDFNKWLLFGVTESNSHTPFINIVLSSARIAIFKRRCLMNSKNKLIECRYLFDFYVRQHLECIYRYWNSEKLDEFYHTIWINNPYVKINNGKIAINWR